MYRFRNRLKCINYNEDYYFDRIGVLDENDIASKYKHINKINEVINIINDSPINSKPDLAIICMHFSNEFVKRYPEHDNFRKALKNKLKILINEYTDKRDKSILQEYYDNL